MHSIYQGEKLWPPPRVEPPPPAAPLVVTTTKEVVPVTPNYFRESLRDSTMYSVALCSVLGWFTLVHFIFYIPKYYIISNSNNLFSKKFMYKLNLFSQSKFTLFF